jgi:hypothetical protein
MTDDWSPAFPGQRPPFAPGNEWRAGPGNERARTHGAFSARLVLPLAKQIAAELRATEGLDYLRAPRFTAALQAYAQAAARAELMRRWIDTMTLNEEFHAGTGKDAPSEQLRQLQTHAANLGHRLGLTPAGAIEIADEIRKARAVLARRAEREALQADLRKSLREQLDRGNDL